jgi:hypothetical protein
MIVQRYRTTARKNALLRSFAWLVMGQRANLNSFRFPPERFNPSLSFQRVLRALGNDAEIIDMRFAPLGLRDTLELAAAFKDANQTVAERYGIWVPPCDITDILLALGVRKTYARTRSLAKARRALRDVVDV